MLTLHIQRSEVRAPAIPDHSDAGLTVWTDPQGVPCAYGHTIGGRQWVHLPAVGAFRFESGSSEVIAVPRAAASSELVMDAFNRTVLPLALQALGHEVLHASAVVVHDHVVAICAVSGTGKSTIAYGLATRGCHLWADDAVCFDASEPPIRALPLPFALRLRPASAEFFAASHDGGRLPRSASHAPLGAIVVLERWKRSAAPAVDRLTGSEAFTSTLTHGYAFDAADQIRTARMVRSYLELVDRIPVFRLSFSPGLEGLSGMLDILEHEVLGALAPVA